MYVYIHIYIHTYIHTYVYIYIYIYIVLDKWFPPSHPLFWRGFHSPSLASGRGARDTNYDRFPYRCL